MKQADETDTRYTGVKLGGGYRLRELRWRQRKPIGHGRSVSKGGSEKRKCRREKMGERQRRDKRGERGLPPGRKAEE